MRLKIWLKAASLACLGGMACFAARAVDITMPRSGPDSGPPSIEDYATIESYCKGEPVYMFGGMCTIYGVSPDLIPGAEMQAGNTHPKKKVRPKKSWEIKNNLMGHTNEVSVKSPWTDSQPFQPIHLIDGDPDTLWCSWGCPVPDARPEWIRIDLPMEMSIGAVALACAKGDYWNSGQRRRTYGHALPRELEVRLSRDAWHWETVHETKDFQGDASGRTVIRFAPRPAKQIWVLANNFPVEVTFSGHVFSIGELEVLDTEGQNVALVSRGAGVTVSSKTSSHDNDWFPQRALWGPLMYDLGDKWARVGVHNGSFTWSYVELEKGKLQIDPWADESITECKRNGVNVILALDMTMANHRYGKNPRKLNWREARYREMNNVYDDSASRDYEDPDYWAGYLRYVEYMANQFKDRVYIYEIGNEWDASPDGRGQFTAERYMKMFPQVYDIIKRVDPKARIMLGNTCTNRMFDVILDCFGRPWKAETRDGKLVTERKLIALAPAAAGNDATISVDAENRGLTGIILDYTDPKNYLVAMHRYHSQGGGTEYKSEAKTEDSIFFQQCTDGLMGERIAELQIKDLGPRIRLTARVNGPRAELSVTDGQQTVSTSHEFKAAQLAGPHGIFYDLSAGHDAKPQAFDNFEVVAQGAASCKFTFDQPDGSVPEGLDFKLGGENPIEPGWAAKLDGVGWHSEGADWEYVNTVKKFKRECEALGFKGRYYCTEIGSSRGWMYPPGALPRRTEMEYAKVQLRKTMTNNGLDTQAGSCHPQFTGFCHPQSFTRMTWPTQTLVPISGSAAYYAWRNTATALDDFHAKEFPVSIIGDLKPMYFTFVSGDQTQRMVSMWDPEKLADGIAETKADVKLEGYQARAAWAVDIFNGTEQPLNLTSDGPDTMLKDMLIKDYPVLVRLEN